MIESPAAVENISGIVAVEGLDAIVIGMADLVNTLGHAENPKHPDVQRAIDAVVQAASRSGRVAAGINLHHWDEGHARIQQGFRWITIHAKTMLARGTQQLQTLLGS